MVAWAGAPGGAQTRPFRQFLYRLRHVEARQPAPLNALRDMEW